MIRELYEGFNIRKRQAEIIGMIGEESGETLECTEHDGNEYVYESEHIKNLVVQFNEHEVRVLDIASRNPGDKVATTVIKVLVDIAQDAGIDVVAEDVLPGAVSWWESLGFLPQTTGSADYIFVGEHNSAVQSHRIDTVTTH